MICSAWRQWCACGVRVVQDVVRDLLPREHNACNVLYLSMFGTPSVPLYCSKGAHRLWHHNHRLLRRSFGDGQCYCCVGIQGKTFRQTFVSAKRHQSPEKIHRITAICKVSPPAFRTVYMYYRGNPPPRRPQPPPFMSKRRPVEVLSKYTHIRRYSFVTCGAIIIDWWVFHPTPLLPVA